MVKIAYQRNTGKSLAAKVVDKRNLSRLQLERLYIEVHILKQISHPNLIKLVDVIENETHMFIITEL